MLSIYLLPSASQLQATPAPSSADALLDLRDDVLKENCQVTAAVARIHDSQGLADVDRPSVDVYYDGHYNVRSLGRSYNPRATIADVVALENVTKLALPIGYECFSKWGNRTKGALQAPSCIANSEAAGVNAIYKDIHADQEAKLTPGAIIRDGDTKITKSKEAVCQELQIPVQDDHACVVHVARNLPNHFWALYTNGKGKPGWSRDSGRRTANSTRLLLSGPPKRSTKHTKNTLLTLCVGAPLQKVRCSMRLVKTRSTALD